MRLMGWKGKKSCVSSTTMVVDTGKSLIFSTTTTHRDLIPATNKEATSPRATTTSRVVTSLGTISKATISLSRTLLLASLAKETNLLNNRLILLVLLLRKAALTLY